VGLRTRDSHALAAKSGAYSESSPPGNVADHRSEQDELDLSLYHYYLPRMKRAIKDENVAVVSRLVADAQEDYAEQVGKPVERHFEDDKSAVAYLLQTFIGVPAEQAALSIRTRTQSVHSAKSWVRNQRRLAGRHPETGEKREVDERTQRIYEMTDDGVKQRDIAVRLNISRPRVSQILAGR
jgi:DNA-directed RNA polymerase specialized sigma subunit